VELMSYQLILTSNGIGKNLYMLKYYDNLTLNLLIIVNYNVLCSTYYLR
jgi:hypothetical protein